MAQTPLSRIRFQNRRTKSAPHWKIADYIYWHVERRKPPTWRNSEASIHNRRGAADTFNTTHGKTEYYTVISVRIVRFCIATFSLSISCLVYRFSFLFLIFDLCCIFCVKTHNLLSWIYLAYLKMLKMLEDAKIYKAASQRWPKMRRRC